MHRLMEYFKIPLAGQRTYNSGSLNNYTRATYLWSSVGSNTYSAVVYFYRNELFVNVGSNRSSAYSLRCFKNRKERICGKITDIPQDECNALVDFYDSTNGDGWTRGFSGDNASN
jgi:hypothetical protein